MENYQAGNTTSNYNYNSGISKEYSLGEYRQKYVGNGFGDSIYNNFMKFIPRVNHGKYEPLK
jgi:hypothetical protein